MKKFSFKNSSLTLKWFAITLSSLLLFISIVMFFQLLFFEEFYLYEKTNTLKTNVAEFKSEFKSFSNIVELYKAGFEFEEMNNVRLAVLNSKGTPLFHSELFLENDYYKDHDILDKAITAWFLSDRYHYDVMVLDKTIDFIFKDSYTDIDYLVIVSAIRDRGDIDGIILTVSPLQPVGEATVIIEKYYKFVFIGALIIIVLLSFINSKMISTPLISLNKTAKKMINLDFSSTCEVKSTDEIGSLAMTLNFLSSKLNSTLSELRDANEKLTEDIEKERLLEKMRKEFVADVSHELKTPISLIEGYAEALKDGIVSPDDMDYYTDVIIDEAKKMNTLVMDMLNLSHMESKLYNLNISEDNIFDVINNIYKKYKLSDQEHKIEFVNMFDTEVVTAKYDVFKIEEVLNNLVTNAIKYTPENEGIQIILQPHTEENILIEVINEGSHIADDDLKLIWDKFYRVDKSRNKDTGGTGLGLAITKNILELHNSTFGVENTDIGVKFYFTLNT